MGYEERWIEGLEEIVTDVDKKIKRGHQRLAMTKEEDSPPNQVHGPRHDQIMQLTTKISKFIISTEHRCIHIEYIFQKNCVYSFVTLESQLKFSLCK